MICHTTWAALCIEATKDTHLERELCAPALLRLHSLAHAEELHSRVAIAPDRAVRALVVAEDVRGGALERARLLVARGLRDRVAEGLCQARDDGRVVAREVVQLDRLRHAVVLLRVLRSAHKDVGVVVRKVVELEQRRALFDHTALRAESDVSMYVCGRAVQCNLRNACRRGGSRPQALPMLHQCWRGR